MGKREFVDRLQAGANLESRTAAEKCLKAILETLIDEMAAGNTIPLRGFGTFKVRTVAHRLGRDFRTGAELDIPAKRSLRFEVGSELRESVNSGRAVAYMQTMSVRFGALRKTLDEMSTRDALRDQYDKLRAAYEASRYQLALLQNASEDAWGELRHGFELAYDDLRDAFAKAKARF